MNTNILTVNQAASEVGVHPNTIKRLLKNGLLKYRRTKPGKTGHIRIHREWLEKMTKSLTRGGEAYGNRS